MGNLRDYEIFKDYSDELLTELSKVIIEKEFEENEIIFREGDEGDSVYIVTEGEIAIKRFLDKPGDEEKTIAMIEKGNFFGEMALFDNQSRSGSAYAAKRSRVLILKKEDFLNLQKKDPNTAMTTLITINRVMSERLRKTSRASSPVSNSEMSCPPSGDSLKVREELKKRLIIVGADLAVTRSPENWGEVRWEWFTRPTILRSEGRSP